MCAKALSCRGWSRPFESWGLHDGRPRDVPRLFPIVVVVVVPGSSRQLHRCAKPGAGCTPARQELRRHTEWTGVAHFRSKTLKVRWQAVWPVLAGTPTHGHVCNTPSRLTLCTFDFSGEWDVSQGPDLVLFRSQVSFTGQDQSNETGGVIPPACLLCFTPLGLSQWS